VLIINIRWGSLELRTNERDFLTNYARNQVGKISQGAAAAENVCGQGFSQAPNTHPSPNTPSRPLSSSHFAAVPYIPYSQEPAATTLGGTSYSPF